MNKITLLLLTIIWISIIRPNWPGIGKKTVSSLTNLYFKFDEIMLSGVLLQALKNELFNSLLRKVFQIIVKIFFRRGMPF